jgi:hydrogenase nickel incorporation protein HypA/HybF
VHELGIATETYRACREALESREPGRLERVRMVVGELSAVEPDLLRFGWEAVTQDGPDEGVRLEIEWRPARQVCADCGVVPERAPGSWLRLCPRCNQPLRLEGGTELHVRDFSYTPLSGRNDDVHRARRRQPAGAGRER